MAAVEEILDGDTFLELADLDGISAAMNALLGEFCAADSAGPVLMAGAVGLAVVCEPGLPDFALLRKKQRAILHRPDPDPRRVGCAVYHEIAEDQAPPGATHTDIQLLGIALSIAPEVADRAVRRLGLPTAVRLLARLHRYVPIWTVWVRCVMSVAARDEAA